MLLEHSKGYKNGVYYVISILFLYVKQSEKD